MARAQYYFPADIAEATPFIHFLEKSGELKQILLTLSFYNAIIRLLVYAPRQKILLRVSRNKKISGELL